MRWCCGFFLLFTWGVPVAAAQGLNGIPEIVDGDTVYLGTTRLRLVGIDAPESDQLCLDAGAKVVTCGLEAKNRLSSYSAGRSWTRTVSGGDPYGRSVATCFIGQEDVSSWLVRNGLALAYRQYSLAYVRDEEPAPIRRGMWSGAFIAPWDWRHGNASTVLLAAVSVPRVAQSALLAPLLVSRPPNAECVIMGNLGRGGQCIYHLPGGRFYNQLKMEVSGRRWFCGERDAEAAGCRRSRL
jgi:endonuclease YncB( thermonuclease family)